VQSQTSSTHAICDKVAIPTPPLLGITFIVRSLSTPLSFIATPRLCVCCAVYVHECVQDGPLLFSFPIEDWSPGIFISRALLELLVTPFYLMIGLDWMIDIIDDDGCMIMCRCSDF
jgi:hypothetical protein